MSDNPFPPLHYAPRPEPFTPPVSLRDYFAAMAMQGFLADSNVRVRNDEGARQLAKSAYGIADAMLRERAK